MVYHILYCVWVLDNNDLIKIKKYNYWQILIKIIIINKYTPINYTTKQYYNKSLKLPTTINNNL